MTQAQLLFCAVVMIVSLTVIDAGPSPETDEDALLKDVIRMNAKLEDKATVKEVCKRLQKALKDELENRKKNGGSGVLEPNDSNNQWINECKKPNAKMDVVMNYFVGIAKESDKSM